MSSFHSLRFKEDLSKFYINLLIILVTTKEKRNQQLVPKIFLNISRMKMILKMNFI